MQIMILVLAIINVSFMLFNILQTAMVIRLIVLYGKMLTSINDLMIEFVKLTCLTNEQESNKLNEIKQQLEKAEAYRFN